jgi:tRNA threonylcarbamoyladenosine biosynthesis protein TsaB
MIMRKVGPLKILALDTATRRGSVALLENRTVVAQLNLASLETHSARLLRSIDFLLASAAWRLPDLSLIAAGLGPGSFTGIRIGLSTALGLAQSLSIPFAGISGMDAAARSAAWIEGRLGVVMDAQRSQIYYAEYLNRGRSIKRIQRPSLWFPGDLNRRLRHKGLYIIGDGIERYLQSLDRVSPHWPRVLDSDLYLATAIARIALERRRCWRSGECLNAEPLYIRLPDARKAKERKY